MGAKGAAHAEITIEGDLDLPRISSECFQTTTISPKTLNVMFDKWARRMNAMVARPVRYGRRNNVKLFLSRLGHVHTTVTFVTT